MEKLYYYLNGEFPENRPYILKEFLKSNPINNKIFTPTLYSSYAKIKPLPGVYLLCFSNSKNYLGYSDDILKDLTLIYLYLKDPNKEDKLFDMLIDNKSGWRDQCLLAPYKKQFFRELSAYLLSSSSSSKGLKYAFAANTLFYINYTTDVAAAKILFNDYWSQLVYNNESGGFYNSHSSTNEFGGNALYKRNDSVNNKKELSVLVDEILNELPQEAFNSHNNTYSIVLPDGDKLSFKSKNSKSYLKKILCAIGSENAAFLRLSNKKMRDLLSTKKLPICVYNTVLEVNGSLYPLKNYSLQKNTKKDDKVAATSLFYNFPQKKKEEKILEIENEMKKVKTQLFSDFLSKYGIDEK